MPEQFDDSNILAGDLSGGITAKSPPVCDPNVYPRAVSGKPAIRTGITEKAGPHYGKRWARLELPFVIDDATQRARLAPRDPQARFSLMLDVMEDPSAPDGWRLTKESDQEGANWRLRKLYLALGMTDIGNLLQLEGRYAKVHVEHEDGHNDPDVKNAVVRRVEEAGS